MSAPIELTRSPALKNAEERLHTLLLEHRGTAIFERVKLYVAKFADGKKLSEYLADGGAPEEDKLRVVSTLVAILSTKDFSRLPELPVMENANAPTVAPVVPVTDADFEVQPADEAEEEDDAPLTAEQIRAIARKEARAELADVLERVARVLRETA